MTLITGLFKDSGGGLITGVLRVQLNAPLSDTATSPDSYLLTLPRDFTITNGVLATCDLKESESAQVSYTFSLFRAFTDYDYFYASTGVYYGRNDERPTFLHTDSKYYTGQTFTPDSLPLERLARPRLEAIGSDFQAIVPNQPSVEYASLERTGYATDRTPQTARQVATALRQDPTFIQLLIDRLIIQPYGPTALYLRGNLVESGGTAYQCLADNTIGLSPAANPTVWRLFVSKGAAGGTGGSDDPFASGWNGDLNAPSKNALWDYISTSLATTAQIGSLAPSSSPVFTGAARYDTQPLNTGAGANKLRLATAEYALLEGLEQARKLMIGWILPVTHTSSPRFTVRANGQTLSRTTYAELWAVANGNPAYGVGNGSTTFTVPNLSNLATNIPYAVFTGV